jgi:cbb3-type cytochrome oxidase subunit 3
LNIVLIWYLLYFSLLSIAVIIFLICFIFYFLKPSTKALFNNKGNG